MTRDDGTRRTRAMAKACEGISTEALEGGCIADLAYWVFWLLIDFERKQPDADGWYSIRIHHNDIDRLRAAHGLIKGEQQ